MLNLQFFAYPNTSGVSQLAGTEMYPKEMKAGERGKGGGDPLYIIKFWLFESAHP